LNTKLFFLNLFELTLQFKGFPIKEAKKRLQEIKAVPEAAYEIYVKDLRQHVFDYHLRENTFYKNFIGNKKISSWNEIPILTKKELQVPLIDRFSHGFNAKNTYTGRTSGSSGKPLVYAKDHFCHAMTWAEIMDRFAWYDLDFNNSYQARFYGIPLDFKNYQKERLKDRLANRFRFPIFDLSKEKLESFLDTFRRKTFDYINGHTSSIVLFAKFLKEKNMVLTSVCPTLTTCVVTSEMLFNDDKKLLEKWIGVPVVNEYGASELDLIAFTNKNNQLQVNNETIFVEIVDENDAIVPHGSPGRIIITSLFNKAHPFVRYDVGDIGILEPTSTFKKPVLQTLVGRANDNAHLPNGTTVPGHTFYYVVKTALSTNSVVKEFIIEQRGIENFHLKYVSEKSLSAEEINSLEKSLLLYIKTDVQLTLEKVAALDRSTGKLKQFANLVDAKKSHE